MQNWRTFENASSIFSPHLVAGNCIPLVFLTVSDRWQFWRSNFLRPPFLRWWLATHNSAAKKKSFLADFNFIGDVLFCFWRSRFESLLFIVLVVTFAIREYWMIYRGPGFLAVVSFGSSSTPFPLSCQQVVSLSQSFYVSPVQLNDRRGGEMLMLCEQPYYSWWAGGLV